MNSPVHDRPRRRSRREESGVALILVLWTFAVLAVLAAEFARAMRDDAQSTLNFRQETMGHYVAIAGINEAILAISSARESDFDPAVDVDTLHEDEQSGRSTMQTLLQGDGQWVHATFDGVPYELRAQDEGGRVPLNDADDEMIRLIMLNLGYTELEAETVSDSILDWTDDDDLHRPNGAEDQYYEALPRPYRARNGPFESVEELLLVRGVTQQMFYGTDVVPGLRDIFSVFNDSKRINLRSMTPAVMMALGGLDQQDAAEMRRRRNVGGRESSEDELRALVDASGLSTRSGAATVLTIEARVRDTKDAVISHVGAVVKIPAGGQDFRTYRWYDAMYSEDG